MRLAERYGNQQPSGMVRIFQAIAGMDGVLDLSIGEPDFTTAPDIVDAAARAGKEGFTHYPPLPGFLDLRESVCAYWERHHGLKASPSEVFVSIGALHAPYLIFAALLNPGDEVLLFEPYFTPYAFQINENGGVPVTLRTREEHGFVPTMEDLRAAATPRTRGILLNSPGNPSGRVLSRKQMEDIAAFAEERDLFVISDEIYESMVFNGRHVCFAALPGMRERTITVAGVSKSHCMTGWRVGFTIAPENLVQMLCVISAFHNYGVCTLAQKAARYALDTQDAKVEERSAVFEARMNAVEARLNAMKGVECHPAEGAFYLFPNIAGTGLSSEEFAWRLLREAKVGALPGDAFGATGEGYIRIACTQSQETLMEAMDKMEQFTAAL